MHGPFVSHFVRRCLRAVTLTVTLARQFYVRCAVKVGKIVRIEPVLNLVHDACGLLDTAGGEDGA